MSMFEYLKIPDIILSLFLHKNWTGLMLLAPTVYIYIYTHTKECSKVIFLPAKVFRVDPKNYIEK